MSPLAPPADGDPKIGDDSHGGDQSPPFHARILSVQTTTDIMATVLTGESITNYRAKVLLSALKLECLGMKRRGPSVYSIVKAEYNLKGSKQSVYNQLESIIG